MINRSSDTHETGAQDIRSAGSTSCCPGHGGAPRRRLADVADRTVTQSPFDLYSNDAGVTHNVVIEFSKERAAYARARQWHKQQTVENRADGAVRIAFPCGNLAPIVSWVLDWGLQARAIEPRGLVDQVIQELDAARWLPLMRCHQRACLPQQLDYHEAAGGVPSAPSAPNAPTVSRPNINVTTERAHPDTSLNIPQSVGRSSPGWQHARDAQQVDSLLAEHGRS